MGTYRTATIPSESSTTPNDVLSGTTSSKPVPNTAHSKVNIGVVDFTLAAAGTYVVCARITRNDVTGAYGQDLKWDAFNPGKSDWQPVVGTNDIVPITVVGPAPNPVPGVSAARWSGRRGRTETVSFAGIQLNTLNNPELRIKNVKECTGTTLYTGTPTATTASSMTFSFSVGGGWSEGPNHGLCVDHDGISGHQYSGSMSITDKHDLQRKWVVAP